MTRLALIRRIPDGSVMPRFYGFAFFDHAMCNAIVAPVPLNLLMGLAVRAWGAMKRGIPTGRDPVLDAYVQGCADGRRAVTAQLNARITRFIPP